MENDNIERLITRLDDHITESDRRHNETAAILKDYKTMIDSKVPYKQFTWIVGFMVLILMAMFSYIALKIDDLSSATQKTQSDISFLTGKLAPYDIQFKNT